MSKRPDLIGNTHARRYAPGVAARRDVLSTYRKNAARSGKEWSLTEEEFFEVTQQNCHYCGIGPSMVLAGCYGDFVYNGVDRKDNAQGYVAGNVLPCCKPCNRAKSDMTYQDFLAFLKRAGEFQLGLQAKGVGV